MSQDVVLLEAIECLAKSEEIKYIFESGTFHGTGSTKIIAEAFKKNKTLKKFFTCEVDLENYLIAKKNLKKYEFVQCIYGCTLSYAEAEKFLETDEAILNHHNYPEIYIDDVVDPMRFYLRELGGKLLSKPTIKNLFFHRKNNLFKKKLGKLNGNLFIILDSAGGVGYLEFKKCINILRHKIFWILLDDIHHLKHFRSRQYIHDNKDEFTLVNENLENGWLLAKHK